MCVFANVNIRLNGMVLSMMQTVRDWRGVTIKVSGELGYDTRREFRAAYQNQPRNTRFTVELFNATGIDSAALGMLLILLEHAGGHKDNVHLVGCNSDIKKLLEIAQFNVLMTIH